jgi:CelD/BcsL family acetyltransferase involved in cellulose biosynthesis
MAEIGLSRSGLVEGVSKDGRSAAHPPIAAPAGPPSTKREWDDLAGRAATDNVFFSPSFVLPAVRFLGGKAIAVATLRGDDGRLLATAPYHRIRFGHVLPGARFWAHDYAPLGAPLLVETESEHAAQGLIDAVATERMCVIVPDLPLMSATAAALAGAARLSGRPLAFLDEHQRATVTRPGADAPALRSDLSRRRRKELARQMRRLADLGTVTVEATVNPAELPARFEEFLALERTGWKGRRETALASRAETAGMGRDLAARLAAERAMRIDAIRVDGKPIAMLVTLIGGSTAYTWKIAYDESFARFSPGAQLMLAVGSSIFSDERIRQIDSCAASNHPMIDHLWHERLRIGTMVIGPVGGGSRFQLALLAAKGEIASRALARRLRDRIRRAARRPTRLRSEHAS